MKKEFLECGKIVTTHGIHGEVKVQPWCDSPEFLCGFRTLYLRGGEQPVEVKQARITGNGMVLLRLEGIDSMDAAVTLRGKILYINRKDAPDDGSYFIQDILGLEVRDADDGHVYGKLSDVFETGANDVYEIKSEDGREYLIPAIPDVLVEINVDAGFMRIRPLKGLFDDAD